MTQSHVGINRDYGDWEWSADAGERARLLQSPSAEEPRPATTSMLGAVFIVVNAALGAGLLNFPAAFRMAGGVAAGIAMQMVKGPSWCCWPRASIMGWAGLGWALWERLLFLGADGCTSKETCPWGGGSCWTIPVFVRQTLQAPRWPSSHWPLGLPSSGQTWGAEQTSSGTPKEPVLARGLRLPSLAGQGLLPA